MSFAVWYACYTLLKNSNEKEPSKPLSQQSYVHNVKGKGRKSITSLRKKFNKNKRGGYCL